MKLVIDINDKDIPQKQDIMDIRIHFIDGEVCECDYPFQKFEKVLEDIKAEILSLKGDNFSKNFYLKIIEKHISGKEK